MNRTLGICLQVPLAFALCAGCSKPRQTGPAPSPAASAGDLEPRLARLEQTLAELQARVRPPPPRATATAAPLHAFQADPQPEAAPADTTRVLQLEQKLAALQATLDRAIDARIDARIGTEQDIQAIFGQVVVDELAKAEARKAEENQRRADEARAQWAERQAARETERLKALCDELQLYERQREQLAKVFSDARTARDAAMTELRQAGAFDGEAYRARMEELRKTRREALALFLTPEQVQAVEQSPLGRSPERGIFFGGQPGQPSVSVQVSETQ